MPHPSVWNLLCKKRKSPRTHERKFLVHIPNSSNLRGTIDRRFLHMLPWREIGEKLKSEEPGYLRSLLSYLLIPRT